MNAEMCSLNKTFGLHLELKHLFNQVPKIHRFQLLKCEYFLVFFVLYDSKFNFFGFWTVS